MAVSGALKLKGSHGIITITNSISDISQGDYNEAMVLNSDPQSLWIIYSECDMSDKDCYSKIIKPSVKDEIYTSLKPNKIRSAQGFDCVNPGIILFKHPNFCGFGHKFVSSEDDLTQYFLQQSKEDNGSISSAIITGGVWSLYTDTNCTGSKLKSAAGTGQAEIEELGPGQYDFGPLKGKSLKYICPSEEEAK